MFFIWAYWDGCFFGLGYFILIEDGIGIVRAAAFVCFRVLSVLGLQDMESRIFIFCTYMYFVEGSMIFYQLRLFYFRENMYR